MKQLTCEMCGSTDLLKNEGVFVCQTCGSKYSVEEAKKMMVEGTVEVTGKVQVGREDEIKNFIARAKQKMSEFKEIDYKKNGYLFINSKHIDEINEYFEKILDLDASNNEVKELKSDFKTYVNNLMVSKEKYEKDNERKSLKKLLMFGLGSFLLLLISLAIDSSFLLGISILGLVIFVSIFALIYLV